MRDRVFYKTDENELYKRCSEKEDQNIGVKYLKT